MTGDSWLIAGCLSMLSCPLAARPARLKTTTCCGRYGFFHHLLCPASNSVIQFKPNSPSLKPTSMLTPASPAASGSSGSAVLGPVVSYFVPESFLFE